MNRLFDFIRKIYLVIIFIILELIAFNSYQDDSVYVRGETHNISNNFLGNVYATIHDITDYFSLKKSNKEILEVNAQLMERLAASENLNMRLLRGEILDTLPKNDSLPNITIPDSMETIEVISDSSIITVMAQNLNRDKYITARVLNNTVTGQHNSITLDRGSIDGIKLNLPVVSNNSIVGYIVAVNKNYSVAISVLNIDFKTSGMLKTDGSLCSIFWAGGNYEEADFSGISRYAKINKGDTIITTGFSSFFTSNKIIGVVKDFSLIDDMYYGGKIKLITEFYKLKNVQIIIPDNLEERLELENEVTNIKDIKE